MIILNDTIIFYEKLIQIFIIILIISWRIYLKLRIKQTNSYTYLFGKVVIVTGANKGIGYFTALDLAKRGAKVILGCKNEQGAILAVKKIIYKTNNKNVSYKILNLMSFESIRKFAMEIDRNEEKIDVLINNAGVAGFGEYLTEDNLQITLQVNYFGPFLLTRLLMRSLKRSESARIINVASHMAKFAKIPKFQIDAYPNDLIDNFAKIRLYANSKLCMIYFTSALAKKLKGNNITVNALHPGGVQTDIFKRLPFQMFIKFITKTWFMTVEEGCRTSIYLATSNEVENVSGKMFDNCTEVDLEKYIKNWELEDIIWEQSEELVCLDRMEKNLIN